MLRQLLDVRVVRWPFKLLYIVGAYGVHFLLARLVLLLQSPDLVVDVLGFVLTNAAVLYGARIFRGRNEDIRAPRELWRMTARRPMSKRLGVTFTVIAALELPLATLSIVQVAGVDLGKFNFNSNTIVDLLFATAQYAVLAFLYLRSARHIPRSLKFMGDPPHQIDRLYGFFNARLADEAIRYLHPEVEWPNAWEGGYLKGRHAVRDYWERHWKELDPKVTPLHIHVEEDGGLRVRVRQVVHDRAGVLLSDGELDHVYRARDGLFDRMEVRNQPASATPPVT